MASLTLKSALDHLETYGADSARWPASVRAGIPTMMGDPDFATRWDEVKAWDDELAEWDLDEGDDEDSVKIESDDEEGEFEDDPDGDEEGPEQEPDFVPMDMDIDLDAVKDLDESLADLLEQQMVGAFDKRIQTDYSRDFDRVEPYPSTGDFDISKYEDRVRKQTGVMQKDLQRLIVARSQSFHVGGHRSGKINAPALHRVSTGDDRVFRRKHTSETMATALSLVVDCSGSMGEEKKIRVAMESAWAFADILDRLKIANEVIGFTTCGFKDVVAHQSIWDDVEAMREKTGLPHGCIRYVPAYIPIFKSFAERFTVEPKRRMARMVETQDGMGANNDATALEYASNRLLMRPESRKIMIVFSDGQPTDGGVNSNIIGNTMKAIIKRLQGQGVETIGIGIKDASVKKYYAKSLVINDVSQLPGAVMKELRKLLLAA